MFADIIGDGAEDLRLDRDDQGRGGFRCRVQRDLAIGLPALQQVGRAGIVDRNGTRLAGLYPATSQRRAHTPAAE